MKLVPFQRYQTLLDDPVFGLDLFDWDLEKFFDRALPGLTSARPGYGALDLIEDEQHYTLRVEAPGFKKEELEVEAANGTLTVRGKSEKEGCHFQRSVSVPRNTDPSAVKARYHDGILEVTLPKPEEIKPRQIQIDVQ